MLISNSSKRLKYNEAGEVFYEHGEEDDEDTEMTFEDLSPDEVEELRLRTKGKKVRGGTNTKAKDKGYVTPESLGVPPSNKIDMRSSIDSSTSMLEDILKQMKSSAATMHQPQPQHCNITVDAQLQILDKQLRLEEMKLERARVESRLKET